MREFSTRSHPYVSAKDSWRRNTPGSTGSSEHALIELAAVLDTASRFAITRVLLVSKELAEAGGRLPGEGGCAACDCEEIALMRGVRIAKD